MNAAQRQGAEIETSKKCKRTIDREEKRLIAEISVNAATNKQKSSARDTAKLDRETEELHRKAIFIHIDLIARTKELYCKKDTVLRIPSYL